MPLTLNPHVMQKEPGTRRSRVVKVIPYARIKKDQGPAVFLQQGKAYGSGGQEIKKANYPEWFWEELGKLSDETLESVGWHKKVKPDSSAQAFPPSEKPIVKRKVRRKKRRKKVLETVESPAMEPQDGNSSANRDVGSEGSL